MGAAWVFVLSIVASSSAVNTDVAVLKFTIFLSLPKAD